MLPFGLILFDIIKFLLILSFQDFLTFKNIIQLKKATFSIEFFFVEHARKPQTINLLFIRKKSSIRVTKEITPFVNYAPSICKQVVIPTNISK